MMTIQSEEPPISFLEKVRFVRRTPSIFIAWILFAIALALIGWGTLFANLREARVVVEQRALFGATALARSHADRLMRSINAIDHITRHVRSDWKLSNRKLQLEKMVEEGVFSHPSQYYVTLVDRDGMTFTSTLPNLAPTFLGDRKYFQIQKNATADNLRIGGPVLSRMSKENVANFSRRMVDSDGDFDGIVLVSVPTDFFTTNYDTTIFGTHGLLGVVSEDHALRVVRIGENILSPDVAAFTSTLISHFTTNSGVPISMEKSGSRTSVVAL